MGSEACDDWTDDGVGCATGCAGSADGISCTYSYGGISSCYPICGDGRVISPEVCDDGPADHIAPFSVTGCMSDCLSSDPRWICVGGNPTT